MAMTAAPNSSQYCHGVNTIIGSIGLCLPSGTLFVLFYSCYDKKVMDFLTNSVSTGFFSVVIVQSTYFCDRGRIL